LAKQQGDQQVLINALLQRAPGSNEVRILEKTANGSRSGGSAGKERQGELILSSAD